MTTYAYILQKRKLKQKKHISKSNSEDNNMNMSKDNNIIISDINENVQNGVNQLNFVNNENQLNNNFINEDNCVSVNMFMNNDYGGSNGKVFIPQLNKNTSKGWMSRVERVSINKIRPIDPCKGIFFKKS